MFATFSMRSSCRAARLSAVAIFVVAVVSSVHAQTTSWIVQSGDWSNAANWNGGVPNNSDTAYVVNGGTANISSGQAKCSGLMLGGNPGTGSTQMTGGSLFSTYLGIGVTSAGYFSQSGGTVTMPFASLIYIDYGGNYDLSGTGLLDGSYEYICTGNFTQFNGTNNLNYLSGVGNGCSHKMM